MFRFLTAACLLSPLYHVLAQTPSGDINPTTTGLSILQLITPTTQASQVPITSVLSSLFPSTILTNKAQARLLYNLRPKLLQFLHIRRQVQILPASRQRHQI